MPEMYDDLWTAAKGMYKMEPAVADGGEVVIYAPHITEVSYTHGRLIDEIGYHCRDYFVKQWDRFKDYPGGVLAHPDPDFVAIDPRFRRYIVANTTIKRLYTGTLWAEGPAWNGVGRYLVWSDIPNNVQMRWMEEDGHISVFRSPSGYSNGNTFDFQGRQLSCEHGGRRVVRYEPDGTITVIADRFQGKRLNSPNDIVVHPDGSIWFTDPPYGINGNYEGFKATRK